MSGGSLNYIYSSIENIIYDIPDIEIKDLAKDFAQLLHDLEWYLSGDYCEGAWNESAHKFREKWLRGKHKERLLKYVDDKCDETRKQLREIIGLSYHCKDCVHFEEVTNSKYGNCKYCHGHMMHSWDNVDDCAHFSATEWEEDIEFQ